VLCDCLQLGVAGDVDNNNNNDDDDDNNNNNNNNNKAKDFWQKVQAAAVYVT